MMSISVEEQRFIESKIADQLKEIGVKNRLHNWFFKLLFVLWALSAIGLFFRLRESGDRPVMALIGAPIFACILVSALYYALLWIYWATDIFLLKPGTSCKWIFYGANASYGSYELASKLGEGKSSEEIDDLIEYLELRQTQIRNAGGDVDVYSELASKLGRKNE